MEAHRHVASRLASALVTGIVWQSDTTTRRLLVGLAIGAVVAVAILAGLALSAAGG